MRNFLLTCFSLLIVVSTIAQNDGKRGLPGASNQPTERSFNNLYALIIGISDYENTDITKLNYADDDAKLFFTYLQTFYKDDLEKSDKLHYKLLIDKEASRANVNSGFRWLKDNAKKNDLVIIYFAGHGNAIGRDAYFYCHNTVADDPDVSAMRFQKIKETLDDFATNSIQSIFIADACHSGLMHSNFSKMHSYLAPEEEQEGKATAKQAFVHRLLSSTGNQVSIEGPDLCNGHGYFTYYLIKGLLGEADRGNPGTGEKDGRITIQELKLYIDDKLHAKIGEKQTPVVFSEDLGYIVGRKFQTIPNEFSCLLEEGTSSGFAYSEAKDEKVFTRKKLTKEQSIIYDSFLKSLNEKRFLAPAENNTIYFFEKLKQSNTSQQVISEISEQWKSAFSEYAQHLVNKYLENGKLPTYEEYEFGSDLVKKYLENGKSNDADYLELKAKQVFLESYALHLRYFQGLLIMPESRRRQLYEKQIEKLEALSNKTELSYIQCVLGRMYLEVGNKDKARNAYTRASVLAPNWAFPIYNLVSLKGKMDIKLKLNEYLRITDLYPDFTDGYVTLAATYRNSKIKMPEKSLKVLEKGLQRALLLNEDKGVIANIYNGFGLHYWAQKDYKKAEEYFLKAITEVKGRYYLAYYNLTAMFRGIGKYELALQYAKKGLEINPYYDDLLSEQGWCFIDLNQLDKAEVAFNLSLDYDSLYTYGYFTLSRLNKFKQKLDESMKYAFKAYKIAESRNDSTAQAEYITEIGSVFSEKGEYITAKIYFEKAIKIDSDCGDAYFYQGFNFINLKENELALKSFEKSKEFGYEVSRQMGYCKKEVGLYKEAIALYRQAYHNTSDNMGVALNISDVFYKLNQKDSALYYIEKSILSNEYYTNRQFDKLESFYLTSIKTKQERWPYYAIGLLWEKGIGRVKDLNQARKWFSYGHQVSFWPATAKLIKLYENGTLQIANKAQILENLKKENNAKRFNIPCLLADGTKRTIDFYTMDYPIDDDDPSKYEVSRINELYEAKVPEEVSTSFNKLYSIAKKNSVSYGDLCIYALEAANEEKGKKIESNVNPEVTEKSALTKFSNGEIDEAFKQMEKTVLSKYPNLEGETFEKSYNLILNNIRENTNNNFIDYYSMGYLFENSPTNQNNGKAIKWYMYAFQMGYEPAYIRLKRLFRFISESKVDWLDKNFKKGFTPHTVNTLNNASVQKSYKIYLLDFPSDYTNPLKQEEERLKEVYDVSIPKKLTDAFKVIYTAAVKEKVSFQELFKKLIEDEERKKLTSNDQQLLDSGVDLLKNNKLSESIEKFNESIKLNPNNGRAYFCRGIAYMYLKEYNNSKIDLEKAVKLVEDNATYYELLGDVYIQLIDYNKAKDVYIKAYELGNNKSKGLCYNLACIYSLEKRSVKALRFFEEALENGFKDFNHIKKDTDLDYIRDISRFKELVEKYSKK